MPFNKGKTLAGSTIGFFFAFLGGLFFISPLSALIGAAIAMIVECLPPASLLARVWQGDAARALFGGMAAHLFGPLDRLMSSALGVLFAALGHARGWPVARGAFGE